MTFQYVLKFDKEYRVPLIGLSKCDFDMQHAIYRMWADYGRSSHLRQAVIHRQYSTCIILLELHDQFSLKQVKINSGLN